MNRLFFLVSTWLFTGMFFGLHAQILDPVKWTQNLRQVDDTHFELILKARLDKDWSIYSQFIEGDGPIPTSFQFTPGDHYELVGKTREEGDRHEGYDPIFEMEVIKFTREATFTQKIKVKKFGVPIVGFLEFMTCDKERCLPPKEVDFRFEPAKASASDIAVEPVDMPVGEAPSEVAAAEDGLFDPVKWSAKVELVSGKTYRATFDAAIQENWAVYSKDNSAEEGPIPTAFTFNPASGVVATGPLLEEGGKKLDAFDPIFEMRVIKYKSSIRYIQNFEVADPTTPLTGYFEYMTCDDKRCLFPPATEFTIHFSEGTITFGGDKVAPVIGTDAASIYPVTNVDLANPASDCSFSTSVETGGKGMWSIFLLGFIGGLLALLTPCVFPMIPLTVSFFTKGSKDRKKGLVNAALYGFFILLVYVLLSIPFHVMDSLNPDILNDISTNIWLNIAFFVIFLFFAFSFFGYYEITMPSSLTNRVSSAEGVGGLVGIFFMALTLALVSFSCTGPILGSLLAGALTSDGGAMQLTAGMTGFGFALALPFALFAAFPGWMNSLPRSGGWLNTVKVVLGFLELALAFKFLSNADLVKHWGLLKIEPFLLIWILIAIAMALYLFGIIRFPHDTPGEKPSKVRVVLGALSMITAIYLASGFRYDEAKQSFTPLTLLSGLAPPVGYSWLYPKDCPNNLECFKDLAQGLAYAKEKNKPVMIDFTGHACVNCRKMEEHVWPRQEVDRYLREEFVLISLYVDEKLELPLDEQITVQSKVTGTRKLKRTGDKWQHFQTEYFNNNSQPFYVLMAPDGTLLNSPVGYTPDAPEYAAFLECGLKAWKEMGK
jgi:thiol:disulfide interchange protein